MLETNPTQMSDQNSCRNSSQGPAPSSDALMSELLTKLEQDRTQQAKFVNTLSMLEYIGARKILKSQVERAVSLEVLSHAAEEIRHAYSLKKVALKMSEGVLSTYSEEHLLGGNLARAYIQGIDYGVERTLTAKNPVTNYLLTTLLLEERANLLYPLYEAFLTRAGFPGVLKAIVREEDAHLASVNKGLAESSLVSSVQMQQLRAMEEAEFTQFFAGILQSL